jgi:fluoride exporter
MVHPFLQVALGGAVGATLRYALGLGIVRATGPTDFPLAILTANVVGSFLMGAFVVAAARYGLTHLSPLVATGLLGGFTTFSSFSLETVTMWERGDTGQTALYVALSVSLSVAALFVGMVVARSIA